MKVFAAVLAGLTAVSAQRIMIGAPPNQGTLTAGHQTVVEIDRPDFQSSAQEVAVVIGINPCSSGFCSSPSDTMGRVLYSGNYNPQLNLNDHSKPPSQSFTVTVPANMPKGPATLGVAHFSLIGAGLEPFMETQNISVVIQ